MITKNDSTRPRTTSPLASLAPQARPRRRAPLAAFISSALGLWACGSPSVPQAANDVVAAPPEPERSAWPVAPKPESVVHAELQTSAQAINPGSKFLLAVRFDIASGYRISWMNPGDVGKSTRVRFEAPEGFSVGPLQFPAPTRFEMPGHLVSYGYENGTAIFAEVTVPEQLAHGQPYRFDVKADWLACQEECAQEELSAWLELASVRLAPEPQLPEELVPHHAAIPQPFSDLPTSALDWTGGSANPALMLKAEKVKWVDFFPGDLEQPKLIGVKPAGDVLNLKFEQASASKPLRGLAVGEIGGKTAFFDINVPWPAAPDESHDEDPAPSAATSRRRLK